MAGLGQIAIRDHEIAERIENSIDLPGQCEPATSHDLPQIVSYGLAFPGQQAAEDQRSYRSNEGLNEARYPDHAVKHQLKSWDVVKAVLVPTLQISPASREVRLCVGMRMCS